MKNTLALAFSLVALALPVTAANAATTVDIKTGVGDLGTLDGNWSIEDANDSAPYIPTNINTAWFSGGAPLGQNGNLVDGARWITPGSNGNGNVAAGLASYVTFFTLSDIATAATLTGSFWSDNRVTSILLNGVSIYLNNGSASQFGGSTGTTLNQWANVAAGENRLEFLVQNDAPQGGANPAGLRVSAVLSAVPEPGTWMLMMLGLGAVGFSMRRRQKTQVRFQFA